MATRSLHFFMRPAEFSEIVEEVATKHGLAVILRRYGLRRHLEIAEVAGTIAMSDGRPADEIYLSFEAPRPAVPEVDGLNPAQLGWVSSDVPREVGDILFLAQMAAKSDWWASELGKVLQNPVSLVLFKRIAPAFRRRLKRPVWARDVDAVGEARAYRDIGYSGGVVQWVKQGRELAQAGPALDKPGNVRFFIEKPVVSLTV